MPVTGQDAVLDRAPVQRKPHVGTAVVHGVDLSVVVVEHGDGPSFPLTTMGPFSLSSSIEATRIGSRKTVFEVLSMMYLLTLRCDDCALYQSKYTRYWPI